MKENKMVMDYAVHCGNADDSVEVLEKLCREEAEKLLWELDFQHQELISVSFWTSDTSDLICVGYFRKDENDEVQYEFDFSETTL